MRGVIKLGLILVPMLLVLGLVLNAIYKARDAAQRTQCQNNLKNIGLALNSYADTYGYFPTGTLPNPELPPDKRLSWVVHVWPFFMEGGIETRRDMDWTKAWDAKENCPPRCRVRVDSKANRWDQELVGENKSFLCPANPVRTDSSLPSPTHYVGVAGVGEDAAELPLSEPRAGFFGYDRKISRKDIKDGTATTVAVAEAVDGGPWTAGGRATVRGLATGRSYLGERGQFGAYHHGTNVLFADGSVRPLTASVSPQVFEALATIAGGEAVPGLDPDDSWR